MSAISAMPLVIPLLLLSGYTLLISAALTGATILAYDCTHLFLGTAPSQQVLRQRRHVASLARAMTLLVSALVVLVVVGAVLATGVTVVVSLQ